MERERLMKADVREACVQVWGRAVRSVSQRWEQRMTSCFTPLHTHLGIFLSQGSDLSFMMMKKAQVVGFSTHLLQRMILILQKRPSARAGLRLRTTAFLFHFRYEVQHIRKQWKQQLLTQISFQTPKVMVIKKKKKTWIHYWESKANLASPSLHYYRETIIDVN